VLKVCKTRILFKDVLLGIFEKLKKKKNSMINLLMIYHMTSNEVKKLTYEYMIWVEYGGLK